MLVGRISEAGLLLFATGLLMVEVFRRERVDGDTVFGAACAYLLLGFSWASLYGLLAHVLPDALEALWQCFTHCLLYHTGTRKTDQCLGLCDMDIAQHGETRGYTAHCRVS